MGTFRYGKGKAVVMKVYIICPVRNIDKWQSEVIEDYVKGLEQKGYRVFYPQRDAPQNSKTGLEIVLAELEAIKSCDEVHIFWDINSKGSHFDLGMAIALNKPLNLALSFMPDGNSKSYEKVIKALQK